MDLRIMTDRDFLGAAELESIDHHFGYISGRFVPSPAFMKVQLMFAEAATDLLWADLVGPETEQTLSFMQERDDLHCVFVDANGARIPMRLVTFQFDEQQQRWQFIARASHDHGFTMIAQRHYQAAPDVFSRLTLLWNDEPVSSDNSAVVARAMTILERKTKNSPVLIGEPGKQRRHAVQAIITMLCASPDILPGEWQIVELNLAKLNHVKEVEQRSHLLRMVLWYGFTMKPRAFFVIEHLDQLVHWAAPLLKPFLARGQMRCLGTASLTDYRAVIEKDMAIQRRFQEILLPDEGHARAG